MTDGAVAYSFTWT